MPVPITESHVVSRDGTKIGFLRRGTGPGIVLVEGAMQDAHNYNELANELAANFTVYTPDRRGRGMSPKPYESSHTIARDVEDIDAILEETGTTRIFGLSSGGMIALESARTLSRVHRAAIYEPPFYPKGMNHDGVRRLNSEIGQGYLAAAMVTSLLVAETAPPLFAMLPLFIANFLTGVALYFDDRKTSQGAKLRDLVPGIRYDFNDVSSMDGKMDTLSSISKPILLLSGTKSQQFLQWSCKQLSEILPQAQHIELEGLDHSGPWNGGGSPAIVAERMRDFFAEDD